MRIVIDLQACQTSSRNRGIGRLSLALARAMVSVGRRHEFWILLSDRFAETIDPVAAQFQGMLPRDRIVVFHQALRPSRWAFLKHREPRSPHPTRAEALAAIQPNAIHIASLFDEHVESLVGDRGIPTAVTLHDLIPLVHTTRYFGKKMHETWYYPKLHELKRADLLLSVTEHSRREAMEQLGIAGEKIVAIRGGIQEIFRPLPPTPTQEQSLRLRLKLDRPFIMYTAGIEWRKNISGLMAAFAMLPTGLRSAYQLAIVCAAPAKEIKKRRKETRALGLAPDDVVFTDFVTDEDLVWLYNLCHLFVFPSLHEGFGLPVGEAMACGAPVIGSNRTAIPEVIGREDALFDPTRPKAIAEAMAAVLTDEEFRQALRRYGPIQARHFTWEESARRAIAALEKLAAVTPRAAEAG
jgi:glycosyltransferase involved in cell wall biosynthesis